MVYQIVLTFIILTFIITCKINFLKKRGTYSIFSIYSFTYNYSLADYTVITDTVICIAYGNGLWTKKLDKIAYNNSLWTTNR